MDARENEDKQKVSWTHALRQIVINCYKYHGREDLLPVFNEDEATQAVDAGSNPAGGPGINPAGQQTANDATEKKPTIIHNVVSNNANNTSVVSYFETNRLPHCQARKFAFTEICWLSFRPVFLEK